VCEHFFPSFQGHLFCQEHDTYPAQRLLNICYQLHTASCSIDISRYIHDSYWIGLYFIHDYLCGLVILAKLYSVWHMSILQKSKFKNVTQPVHERSLEIQQLELYAQDTKSRRYDPC